MSVSSRITLSKSQQNEQLILQQLAKVNYSWLAEQIKCDGSKLSRWLAGTNGGGMTFRQIFDLFPLINIALVEAEGGSTVTVPREQYNAIAYLARRALEGHGVVACPE